MEEIWKPIPGYENLYQASNLGNIRSLDKDVWNGHAYYKVKGRVLKPAVKSNGYKELVLRKDNKSKTWGVHKLVLMSFSDGQTNSHAAHKDGNKLNNNINNLYWASPKENARDKLRHGTHSRGKRMYASRFSEKDVIKIYEDTRSHREIASEYKASIASIGAIKRGKNWAWLTGAKRPEYREKSGTIKKLNEKIAIEIYKSNDSYHDIAYKYGIHPRTVYKIKNKETWKQIHNKTSLHQKC